MYKWFCILKLCQGVAIPEEVRTPLNVAGTSLTKTMTRSFVLDLQLLLLSRTFMPMEWLNTWMGKTISQELGIIRIIISVIIITNSHKNGFILQHCKKKEIALFL